MALRTTLVTCRELGVLLAENKVEGPVPLLTFQGIELNPMTMSPGLPEDKLASLRDLIHRIQNAKCTRNAHQLQSLIGHLNHTYVPGHATREGLSEQPFPLANNMRQGQIRCLNTAPRTDLAMVADYALQLVWYLYPPIPSLARALSLHVLRRTWVIGLWCLLFTTLAAVCMAKEEPSPFHCTQGALPYRTCMSSMGAPVGRNMGSEGQSVSTIQSYIQRCPTPLPNPGRPRQLFSVLSLPTYGNSAVRD